MPFTPPERFNLASYLLDQRLEEGLGESVALRLDEGSLTYEQVWRLANRCARVMRERGLRQEERVLLILPDGAPFVGVLFGALKLGAVPVMVNPRLGPEQLAALIDYSRARLAVVHENALEGYQAAAAKASWRPRRLAAGAGGRDEETLEGELEAAADEALTVATHRDDPALWLFSGGTTGRPKAVVQTHRSFANTTELYAKRALGYRPDDITLAVPRLYFGYATGSALFFPFAVGASTVLFPEHPTAEVVFERIARHRPSILVNVPTMVNQMVGHPHAAEQDLGCLRFATSAGEALPVPLYHRWKETFGVELLDGLGTAEMWHIFVTNLPGGVRPGTLGRPVPGFEVRVRDEGGRDLPPGEVGQLWVKGDSRALGYWQNLPATTRAFRGEWFVGGDLVRRDDDGYITYCGRSDDVLKVGGKWLAPQEVESCLMTHPEVADCAVVGIATEEGLTKPCAFVVPQGASREGLEERLQAHVLARLEPYKHPRRVVLLESLPRTHLGKIDRGKLKSLV